MDAAANAARVAGFQVHGFVAPGVFWSIMRLMVLVFFAALARTVLAQEFLVASVRPNVSGLLVVDRADRLPTEN